MLSKTITVNGRTIEIRSNTGIWKDAKFNSIRKGDVFRMFEDKQKNIPVETLAKQTIFLATGNVKKGINGIFQVDIKALNGDIFKPRPISS